MAHPTSNRKLRPRKQCLRDDKGQPKPTDEVTEVSPDARVLRALIAQISEQFNDILAGKYPKLLPTAKPEKETVVGSTHLQFDSSEQPVDIDTDASHIPPSVDQPEDKTVEKPKEQAPKPKPLQPPQPVVLLGVQQPTIDLKMDKIKLPMFDGDLTKWLSFKEQFVDLVHNNARYTPVTKFIQLRSHLTGRALEVINGFQLTAPDYEAAWPALTRRYDKPDRIIDEYLKKLDNLPRLTNPVAEQLEAMVNCTNQILRVLPILGINVSTWDTIIKYKLTTKLDHATHKKWLDTIKLRQNVPLSELVEFLEVQVNEASALDKPHPHQQQSKRDHARRSNRPPRKGGVAVASTVAKPSPTKEGLPLYLCNTFKRLSVRDRISKVKGFKICNRCLRSHENPADYTFGKCPVCTGDHNKLLCYAKEKQDKASGVQTTSTATQE